jgi:hypothetical protein
VKLHDFGLWFKKTGGDWSTTIPEEDCFDILYDGHFLAWWSRDNELFIWEGEPHIVIYYEPSDLTYRSTRLQLKDFEIVPNPNYRGPK